MNAGPRGHSTVSFRPLAEVILSAAKNQRSEDLS